MTSAPAASITRRSVLSGIAAAVAASPLEAWSLPEAVPIIDSHMHLFDPTRPQGAPYRGPETSIYYRTGASPETYSRVARRDGVIGAIAVEASPWIEDNLWVLETAQRAEIIVATIGNLRPEAAEFPEYLERYHRNPLFRGIRYGNIWDYDIVAQSTQARFLAGLKLLAQGDLALDTANPRIDLLQAVVRISDVVPELRIVINHLPKLEPTAAEAADYAAVLREISQRPNLFVKLSAVIHAVGGRASTKLVDHKDRLDMLWDLFGDDRVMFGSDWPTIEWDAPVHSEFAIMRAYLAGKVCAQHEKFFWRNSMKAYKWTPRTEAQWRLK